MNPKDPNLPQLRCIAGALGELREQLVFVGGSVAGLLLTDPLAEGVRATTDVDAIVEAGRAAFHQLESELSDRGFMRDMTSEVICRWVHRESGLLFDLMPVDDAVLGFTNPWYAYAVQTAESLEIAEGVSIRVLSAVAFVGTKLEAFASGGNGDFRASRALEDVLNVVDGREQLAEEMAGAPEALRVFVARTFAGLLGQPNFTNVLPGLIAEPERADVVSARLREMC
ncbi:hypothetical protein GPA19_15765 [Azoarcus indigens]|uniref:Nucleotidyltransferase AbiEii toxin of type IV toxin-antitoxin system n=1 Tax=Azoarcus indigens TaxID=29545 RepID=A0A4R6DJT1_9RHOO|nr:hypothetical protein [Azoarcus indigens]NMG66401.1 hypothetical protein [Azoarcus indigens]TDN45066.1 hypothetical protein C7389_13136 [Azoarcus indigens]